MASLLPRLLSGSRPSGLRVGLCLLGTLCGGAGALQAQIVTPIDSSLISAAQGVRQPIAQSAAIQQFSYGLSPQYQREGWSYSSNLFQTSFDPQLFSSFRRARGTDFEKATFNFGPLAIDLNRWRTQVIASDNVNATPVAESGWIARSSLSIQVSLRLSESFFLRLSGDLTWLPLQNKIGLNGFDLSDSFGDRSGLSASMGLGNNLSMGWRGIINGWEVLAFNALQNDWLSAQWDATASANLAYSVWDPVTFESVDRAGRYAFGSSTRYGSLEDGGVAELRSTSTSLGDRKESLRNVTGLNATRDLESVGARFDLSVSNTYEWRDRPSSDETNETRRQGVTATVHSVRDNSRFRPFMVGKVFRTDNHDWSESGAVGVTSQLTDQVSGVASVGYVRLPSNVETTTFRLGLRHVAGPYTVHSASLRREVYDDYRVRTGLDYRLSQVLASRLTGTFLFAIGESETFDGTGFVNYDESWGIQLSLKLSEALRVNASWFYNRQRGVDDSPPDFVSERYQFRLQAVQDLKSVGRISAVYLHDDYSTTSLIKDYKENVIFLTYEKDL